MFNNKEILGFFELANNSDFLNWSISKFWKFAGDWRLMFDKANSSTFYRPILLNSFSMLILGKNSPSSRFTFIFLN